MTDEPDPIILVADPRSCLLEEYDVTHNTDPENDASRLQGVVRESDGGLQPPPRPRWVIWLVVGVAVAVLLYFGVHLLMGGGRGPMNHGGGHGGMKMVMSGPVAAVVG